MSQALQLTVPPGMSAGQEMQFRTPSGQVMAVQIPPGVPPGHTFTFTLPEAPVPMGTAVAGGSIPMGVRPPAAHQFAECPITYEPLHTGPVGVFLDRSGNRVSQHYFSLAGAEEWLRSGGGSCPMTRKPVASVLPIPRLVDDPEGWFTAVDVDKNGKLSRSEAIEAIKAQFALDNMALDAAIADASHPLWVQWDKDGSGTLERHELLGPDGLVEAAKINFAWRPPQTAGPPELNIANKMAWFDYWDSRAAGGDNSGALDQEEVLRGLIKTLRLSSDPSRVQDVRQNLSAIWAIFDTDGSGTIERGEFLQADGLADTIIATMAAGGGS